MKKILFTSVFTLLLAFSFTAYSAEGGWYMSGNLGLTSVNDTDVASFDEDDIEYMVGEDVPSGTSGSAEIGYDMGFILGVAVGYDFGSIRLESELAYQMNDIDDMKVRITIPGRGSASAGGGLDGDVSSLTLLLNGYYDFRKGSKLQPYITGGIGLSSAEADIEGESDDDTVFAYQVGAGMGYGISENTTIDLRYRYFGSSDPMDIEYSSHSVSLGLRYSF